VGEGRPLIMLHGMPTDHRSMKADMEPVFEQRPGWQRIYPDLPGMGKTPGSSAITSEDHLLDVVIQFVDRLIPGLRYSVAGLSYGGYLARGLVYRQGARIDGVLMTVPAVIMDEARRDLPTLIVIERDEELMAEIEPALRQAMEPMVVAQSRRVVEGWQRDILPAISMADHEFLKQIRQIEQFSFEADLGHVVFERPTLILTGRQDNVCGYRQAWDLLDQFPRATFAVLDRAGHFLTIEQEGLFRALVSEWLDRVEEAG